MILNVLSAYKADKTLDHPLLGTVSCSGSRDAYQKCHELIASNSHIKSNCKSLYLLAMHCFTSENNQAFSAWIDQEVDQRKALLAHLQANQSILPSLFQKNMVNDLFYNVIQDEAKITQNEQARFQHNYQQMAKDNA